MKKIFVTIFSLLFISVLFLYGIGSYLIFPANQVVGSAPVDLNTQEIELNGIRGWFVRSENEVARCVLLMHGVGADRRSMIQHARFLKEAGYSSILFDFQAHGESLGEKITFGFLESENAKSILLYAREKLQCQKVAAIGHSLGGAASLLGEEPLLVDALILEAVYSDIETAISNRIVMRLGAWGEHLTPLLSQQIPLRWGIALEELKPINAISNLKSPVLMIAGGKDRHTSLAESEAIFKAAPEPKSFWVLEDAAHVDFHRYDKARYEKRVLKFLDRYL